jgi:hypothetical protein
MKILSIQGSRRRENGKDLVCQQGKKGVDKNSLSFFNTKKFPKEN